MFKIPTVTQIEKVTNNIVNTRYLPENIKKKIYIYKNNNVKKFDKI